VTAVAPPSGSDVGRAAGQPAGHRRRRAARRKAVEVLYQAAVTERSGHDVLDEWTRFGRPVQSYTTSLVEGVERSLAEIDALLSANAEGWTVARMPPVDRTIMRVATYELLSGVPPAVAIDEAVRAAHELSTEDSGRFANGVLGRIARALEAGDTQEGDSV
jgi:transcription antitermination protein NusB